ncbi:MAG TPA: hypothetical protein DD670_10530 [Planctomycetaceae bacterium]|nr:hypothetical protein [Planctomycetaceae bacterium]
MSQDERYLDLLAVFHYVLGGVLACFACFPFLHIAVGIAIVSGAFDQGSRNPPPEVFGWVFIVVGSIFVLAGWTLATLVVLAGRRLKRRKAYTFCVVVAGLECMFMPIGTTLGVLTIILLMKDSTRALFPDGQSTS